MPDPFERHGSNKWEWGTSPSRSQQRREAAVKSDPEPPKKGRNKSKNTALWCRGKEGVPHRETLKMYSHYNRSTCGWHPLWDRRSRDFEVGWWCGHQAVCAECGRIIEDRIPVERCPRYPGTPEEKKATELRLVKTREEYEARMAKYRRKPPITGPQHYRKK